MDINFTKHNVNTEDVVLCETVEVPVEGNLVVYDDGKQIKKLLKTCFKGAITSKTLLDKSIRIDGTLNVCLIYIDENNCLGSFSHILPFSKTIETASELSNGKIFAEITEDKLTASHMGDNKVSIAGSVCVKICVKKYSGQQFVCDIDNDYIEQLKGESEITTTLGFAEKNFIAEEEIAIGNGQPSVGCVIRNHATAIVDEVKIINNKVMFKGRCKIYVLYMPCEGTRPQCFEESFPFSQLIDVEGINDNCKCDATAEVVFCELTPRKSAGDEIRSFGVSLKILLSVKAYCDDTVPILLDAYSTKGDCKAVKQEVCFKKIRSNINDKFIAKKTLEFTDGAIGSVIDVWCEGKTHSKRIEGGFLKISGIIVINILAYDAEGVPNCYERPVDFEYTYEIGEELSNPDASYSVNTERCSYTLLGANTIDLSAEVAVCATLYENKKQWLLTNLEEGAEEGKNNMGSGIILYCADKGERIWDIARRYNSSMREIKDLNDIDEEVLSKQTKIIIPIK